MLGIIADFFFIVAAALMLSDAKKAYEVEIPWKTVALIVGGSFLSLVYRVDVGAELPALFTMAFFTGEWVAIGAVKGWKEYSISRRAGDNDNW